MGNRCCYYKIGITVIPKNGIVTLEIVRRDKGQLDATQWFIELIIRSTCFRHYCAHHQELETIQMVTAADDGHNIRNILSGLLVQ